MTKLQELIDKGLELSGKATKRPWQNIQDGIRCVFPSSRDEEWNDWIGLKVSQFPLVGQQEDNAEFIVHACNTHDTLLKIISEQQKALEWYSKHSWIVTNNEHNGEEYPEKEGCTHDIGRRAKECLSKVEALAKEMQEEKDES